MKRQLCLLLAFCIACCMAFPCTADESSSTHVFIPGLCIEGTTAYCSLEVNCDYITDEVSAIIRLWRNGSCIATWVEYAEGYMDFNATRTVDPGSSFRLTADIVINGQAYPMIYHDAQ